MATTIPAVLDRLVTVFGTAVPEARVDDGPTTHLPELRNTGYTVEVIVGWRDDGAGVELDLSREGGAADNREVYRVHCQVTVASGDIGSIVGQRAEAFDLFNRMQAQLRAEAPLVEGVLQVRVDYFDYFPVLDSRYEGASGVTLRFGVLVDAFSPLG